MRKRNQEKIVDITTTILEVLARFSMVGFDAMTRKKEFYNQIYRYGFDRTHISNRVRFLINSGHIEAYEESGQKSIRLTQKGNLKRIEQNQNTDSDGRWRIISFDIPEDKKLLRVALTRSLRRIGYKPIQKSLWICPFNKADEIDLLISELGINDFVANFRVEKNQTDIKQHLLDLFDEL